MDWINSVSQYCVYLFAVPLILLAIGMGYLLLKAEKDGRELPGRIARATPATAKVLEVGDSFTNTYGDLKIGLRLQVTPPAGDPYETFSMWYVKPTHIKNVQVGKALDIKIDAQNPKIIFPGEQLSWASQISLHATDEYTFYGTSRSGDKNVQVRFAQAVPASATIVEVGNSYNERDFGISVALRLQVSPPSGSPYEVISVWDVQPTHSDDMQVGKELSVRIDKQDSKVVFPADSWAQQTYLKPYTEADMKN